MFLDTLYILWSYVVLKSLHPQWCTCIKTQERWKRLFPHILHIRSQNLPVKASILKLDTPFQVQRQFFCHFWAPSEESHGWSCLSKHPYTAVWYCWYFHGALEEEIDDVLSSHEKIKDKGIIGNVFGMSRSTCNRRLFMTGPSELMKSTSVRGIPHSCKSLRNCSITRLTWSGSSSIGISLSTHWAGAKDQTHIPTQNLWTKMLKSHHK